MRQSCFACVFWLCFVRPVLYLRLPSYLRSMAIMFLRRVISGPPYTNASHRHQQVSCAFAVNARTAFGLGWSEAPPSRTFAFQASCFSGPASYIFNELLDDGVSPPSAVYVHSASHGLYLFLACDSYPHSAPTMAMRMRSMRDG